MSIMHLTCVIILLGPPGSGKGTQAVRLSKELMKPHISTGDLFRENIRQKTSLGIKAKEYVDQGKLSPDELVFDMLFDRIALPDCNAGYVLDGFPRTLPQAEILSQRLNETRQIVLNLNVADKTIIKRLTGRLTCKKCGHVHHQEFYPSAVPGVCDKCSGELYQRPDDSPEVVMERLRVYYAQTRPVEDFYTKKGVLINIDGERPPDTVFFELKARIANALK